jgi:hypothetical protein
MCDIFHQWVHLAFMTTGLLLISGAGWFRRSGLKRWQFIVRIGVDIGYGGYAGEGWGRTGIIRAGWYWDVGDVVELDIFDGFRGGRGLKWRWRKVGTRKRLVQA